MSVLDLSTVIPGTVYVVWVKDSDGYKDPDTMYGLAFKGNSRFGHQDFSHVCELKNGKVFRSKRIDEDRMDPTWAECLEALQMFQAPGGTPVKLIDRLYTFAELAYLGYKDHYFTCEEGLQYLVS